MTLRTVHHIRELSSGAAERGLPVEFEGVATLVDHPRFLCFVQDNTGGIYLEGAGVFEFRTGQRVRVTGVTRRGLFSPVVSAQSIQVLGMAALPPARPASLPEFGTGLFDCERVSLEGRVLSLTSQEQRWRFKLSEGGQKAVVWLDVPVDLPTNRLLGARIRVRGVCCGAFNERNEITDFQLHAVGLESLDVLESPLADEAVRVSSIAEIETKSPSKVRYRGRVTLHWPGRFLFVQEGANSLEVQTDEPVTLAAGDEIEITGRRSVANRRMILTDCSVQKLSAGTPPPPTLVSFDEIHARHSHGDAVTLEGEVVDLVDRPTAWRAAQPSLAGAFLVLRERGWTVPVEMPPGSGREQLNGIETGCRLRASGVLVADPVPVGDPLTYRLLVDNDGALQVVRGIPWWKDRRILWGGVATAITLISVLGWVIGWNQHRRRQMELVLRQQREKAMRHRDALLALTRLVQTPKETETLREITAMVSRTLTVARVSVWRLEDGGTELLCLDEFAAPDHHGTGERLIVGDYPAYFAALRESRIVAVDDACNDPRTREFAAGYLIPQGIVSMLDVPLRMEGKLAGVLCIEHVGKSIRAWEDEEQSFAAAVADQLTILRGAAERLRAERALREAHAQLETRVMLRTTQLAEARDRAEAADRFKSAFLATMSHELRTPMNSIIGFTGILLQGLVGTLNAEQQKQLGMVQASARHLLSLINDVLDLSKIEAGQIEVSRTAFDLRETIQHVVELVTPQTQRKGLQLTAEIGPGVNGMVSDRRRVEQILINLVNNAVKFTEQGRVRLSAEAAGEWVLLRVSDTGIGIRSEDLPKLFKPFQQLDSGLARHHEGTGLGLAICQGLVKLLGGTVEVESEPGRGSTFTLKLPHNRTQA